METHNPITFFYFPFQFSFQFAVVESADVWARQIEKGDCAGDIAIGHRFKSYRRRHNTICDTFIISAFCASVVFIV